MTVRPVILWMGIFSSVVFLCKKAWESFIKAKKFFWVCHLVDVNTVVRHGVM